MFEFKNAITAPKPDTYQKFNAYLNPDSFFSGNRFLADQLQKRLRMLHQINIRTEK
jgi:hypothetical protein